MRNRISNSTRRFEFQQLARSVAIGCTLVCSLQPWVLGQEATCGCEVHLPTCDGACSKTKKPKQLSVAQQFLKQFDRIGDEIEAQSGFKQPANRNRKPVKANCCVEFHAASCSTELVEPTCGAESSGPNCGCDICSAMPSKAFHHALPMQTPINPLPSAREMQRSQPLYFQESPSIQSNPPTPPVKKQMPSTPMHPQIAPDQQAVGKLKDQPALEPTKPVRTLESVPNNRDLPAEQRDLPTANPQNIREPFAPRHPQVAPKPVDEAVPRLPFISPQPARLPTTPNVPSGSPVQNFPQSQEEIPDVLVDPFKDDVSWKGRRDQMNGVRQIGGAIIGPAEPTSTEARPVPLKLAPHQESEESPSSVISIGPSFGTEEIAVVASTHLERLPVRVHTAKRILPASDNETVPFVKRTPVPRK